MTDRRRKRKTTNSFTDNTVKDFNAVDPVQARRRSDWGDDESRARHESWMSKVSLAMSSRIFSGGKKLSGSRSTQVMPIGVVLRVSSKRSVGHMSSSSATSLPESELQQVSSGPIRNQPTLRLVSSEKTLVNAKDVTSSAVTSLEKCPDVACDVASESSDNSCHDDDNGSRSPSRGPTNYQNNNRRRSTSRRQEFNAVVHKVRPVDEGEDEEEVITASTRTRVVSIPSRTMHGRDAGEDGGSEAIIQDAAPILKGFFSKSVSSSKEQRQQQREQRREALYQQTKQRQDKLREQTERERLANEESSRRRKVEQLRRLNQGRRMQLLRDAASARRNLHQKIQMDSDMYHAERARWENDFEDEMRVLSEAFKKARTTDENRPMTVAGLAVPEAISQLERDASNFEKRVKTAQPALANMPPRQCRTERPSTSGATPSSVEADPSFPFFESCEVLAIDDSKDELDLFGGDDQDFPSKHTNINVVNCTQQTTLDIKQLLEEREKLLQRLAAIDEMVQQHQQEQ